MKVKRPLLTSIFLYMSTGISVKAEIPSLCLERPNRVQVCPNIVYKKSPVDVPALHVKTGEIVCICMADFAELRVEATDEVEKIKQKSSLKMAAGLTGLSEQDLLTLIRK